MILNWQRCIQFDRELYYSATIMKPVEINADRKEQRPSIRATRRGPVFDANVESASSCRGTEPSANRTGKTTERKSTVSRSRMEEFRATVRYHNSDVMKISVLA